MAKVESIQSGIKALKQQLSAPKDTSAGDVLRAINFIAQQQQVLMGAFGNLQQQVDNNQQSVTQLVKALKGAKLDLKAATSVQTQLSRIEKDLTGVPREFPVPKDIDIPDASKQLARIEASLKELPTSIPIPKDNDTLMGEIRDSLLMLFEKPLPESVKSDIMDLSQLMGEKKEFEISFDRDSQGFLESPIRIRQI